MKLKGILTRYLAEFLWVFIFLYLLISFAPPTLYKLGYEGAATTIHSIYRVFCHQRVERSLFLWGEDAVANTYSIEELQYLGVIPDENPHVHESLSHEIYAYPYVGNEFVGYKVALCVRDISIYSAMLLVGLVYLLYANRSGKIKKYNWKMLMVFMIPMAIDGSFQIISELANWEWVPSVYYTANGKRFITGALFGIGFALLIFPNMKENAEFLYNDTNKVTSAEKH